MQRRGGGFGTKSCVRHCSDAIRDKLYEGISSGAPMNFLRGVRFSRSIFNDILHHAPRDGQGRPVLTNLDMGNSIADFPLVFDGVVFKGVSNFSGADLRRLEGN